MNIVLIPGLLSSGWWPGSEYFVGVRRTLERSVRTRVFTPILPFRSVAERASAAADQISAALRTGALDSALPIHLVAHSMGGCDARFLVSRDVGQLRRRVASVTCIGTPHLGCPLLTLLAGAVRTGRDLWAVLANWFPCGLANLPSAFPQRVFDQDLVRLDRECPDVGDVRYFDIAGIGRQDGRPTAMLFVPTGLLLSACGERQHDGLVGARSASRNRTPLALWDEDHAGLIGHDLDSMIGGRTSDHHLPRYEWLANVLCDVRPS